MYGTNPCCKSILGYRKIYKGFVIHALREIEAALCIYRYMFARVRGKADT